MPNHNIQPVLYKLPHLLWQQKALFNSQLSVLEHEIFNTDFASFADKFDLSALGTSVHRQSIEDRNKPLAVWMAFLKN